MDLGRITPRRISSIEATDSVLNILEQVSELTLQASSPRQSPSEQFQTPQVVRKRALSFVVTPPRVHTRGPIDYECIENTQLTFGFSRGGGLPLLPDSTTLDASNHNFVGRHRPLHSPLEGYVSAANTDFFEKFGRSNTSTTTTPSLRRRTTTTSTPPHHHHHKLPATLVRPALTTFPTLEDDDAYRPRDVVVVSRALKMRRCTQEGRFILEDRL